MVKFSLILSIIWFFIAGLWSVMVFKSFGSGDTGMILIQLLVLAVSVFAGLMNLRRYLRMKDK